MRSNTVITAFAFALAVGTAGVAGAQGAGRAEGPRAAHDSTHRGGFEGRGHRGGPEHMLLRGITLSADQQAQLKSLGERRRQEWEAQRKDGQARPERQRGDTTGLGALRAKMEQQREQHLAEIRNILTPDQRVQFDKNVAELKAHAGKREGQWRGKKA